MAPMGGAFDEDGARSWLERNLARYQQDGFGRYGLFWKESGKQVGDCGLITTTVEGSAELELGWIVERASRGLGIATEAAIAWRDHAFGPLGVDRIISMIAEENLPSSRVAEKIGMRFERMAEWTDGLTYRMYALVETPS
jgi:RimJ/RimL family protein N-acetyltransferase